MPKKNRTTGRRFDVLVWAVGLIVALAPPTFAQELSLLGGDLKLGRCTQPGPYALAVHGGTARQPSNYEGGTARIARLLDEAGPALDSGATSVDLVHAVVRAMEDSGLFNAGKGARANKAGVVEMDASIMDGKRLNAGAVASVKTAKNPITAAKLVMQRSPQVMFVGPDAEAFLAKNRGAIVGPEYFRLSGFNFDDIPLPDDIEITTPGSNLPPSLVNLSGVWGGIFNGAMTVLLVVEEVTPSGARVVFGHGISPSWNAHEGYAARHDAELDGGILRMSITHPSDGDVGFRLGADGRLDAVYNVRKRGRLSARMKRLDAVPKSDNQGTVGAVALDRCGDLAAATSTGGYGSKPPGRVGDSPIIGAGTYANNTTAAISATGHGEFFMRYVVAYDISARMEYGGLSLEDAAQEVINGKLARAQGRGGVIAVDTEGNVVTAFNTGGMVRGMVTDRQPPRVAVY